MTKLNGKPISRLVMVKLGQMKEKTRKYPILLAVDPSTGLKVKVFVIYRMLEGYVCGGDKKIETKIEVKHESEGGQPVIVDTNDMDTCKIFTDIGEVDLIVQKWF